MNSFNPAIVIPVYRHGKACMNVVNSLEEYCRSTSTKIILVDDGNEEETKNCLSQISSEYPDLVTLVTLPQNSGKGGAFFAGIKKCTELGITHALQIDADGQHDTNRCAFFLKRAEENPDEMICGYPEYDESAPGHRKNGRKFANTWCSVVTWEKHIKDSMCGFRLYPVEKTFRCISKSRMDMRMGFDIDILVRLIWSGLTYAFYPVKVTYPSDGISNFNVVRDNVRISWVFTKLCCGMFLRIPLLLWRKISGSHLYKGGE